MTPLATMIMTLIIGSETPLWGYKITRMLDRPKGTVYPVLNRLSDAGWITGSDEPVDGAPTRRVYRATDLGIRVFETEERRD